MERNNYYDLAWVLSLGAITCVYFAHLWKVETTFRWWDLIPRRRGKAMRRARRDWVRRDAIDAFVNHVEERVYSGEYSRKEASELYRDARKYWPVKDLFPSPELLKKNIEYRLKNQVHKDAPLPDRKEKARPKHAFEKPAKA